MPSYSPALSALLDRVRPPEVGVVTDEIDYTAGDTPCRGFVAAPAGVQAAPAVLVIHDWLGVGPYVQMRCEMLARLGYIAFAGDIFGADTRPSDAEAPAVAGRFYGDRELWRSRVVAAYEQLLRLDGVDASRTAVLGYCFGGATALELARTGADLRGAISVHGGLPIGPEGEAAGIRASLLIQLGAIDPVVPDDAVLAAQKEFRAAPSLEWQMTTYSGAMHAFSLPDANAPEHGAQFNPVAERRSWSALREFLGEIFAPAA